MEKPLECLANPSAFFTFGKTPNILFSFKEDTLYLSNRSLRGLWKLRLISPYAVAEGSNYLGVDLNRVKKLALSSGAYFEFNLIISWISEVLSWFNNLKRSHL
jgi:hypothetical protein